MRAALLIAGLSLSVLPVSGPAQSPSAPPAAATCRAGEQPISYHQGWPEKSDAICDYDFAEANRRLAGLLEVPGGSTNAETLQALLGFPRFNLRDEYTLNEFYRINAGYTVVLANSNGGDMVIEAYANRRKGAWGSKTSFTATFHQAVPMTQLDSRQNPGCLTEAAVLDRALAAGWRYVPGSTQGGTAGPVFIPGALARDDGRSLVLAKLSRTTVLPPRGTLEATCAWIFSFSELREVKTPEEEG